MHRRASRVRAGMLPRLTSERMWGSGPVAFHPDHALPRDTLPRQFGPLHSKVLNKPRKFLCM